MTFMKAFKLLIFFLLYAILFPTVSYSQELGDIGYPVSANLRNVVFEMDDANNCTSTSYDIGTKYAKIKFIAEKGSDYYIIEVIGNGANKNTSDNYAPINERYCIEKEKYIQDFRDTKRSNTRTAYGMLGVPFKLRFSPTTIAPGGELGGFYGWYLGGTKWIAAFHAGLTLIALNDVNSDTPENKTGFTGGVTLINDTSSNFQFGIVSGVDIFDGVDDWVYKYTPWISIQVGFKFTKEVDN